MQTFKKISAAAALYALVAGLGTAQAQGAKVTKPAGGPVLSQPKPPACATSLEEKKKWTNLLDKPMPMCPVGYPTPPSCVNSTEEKSLWATVADINVPMCPPTGGAPCNPATGLNCTPPTTPTTPTPTTPTPTTPSGNPCASGATVGTNCPPPVSNPCKSNTQPGCGSGGSSTPMPGKLTKLSGPAEATMEPSSTPNWAGLMYKSVELDFTIESTGDKCVFRLLQLSRDLEQTHDYMAQGPSRHIQVRFDVPGMYDVTAQTMPEDPAKEPPELRLTPCQGKVSTRINILAPGPRK